MLWLWQWYVKYQGDCDVEVAVGFEVGTTLVGSYDCMAQTSTIYRIYVKLSLTINSVTWFLHCTSQKILITNHLVPYKNNNLISYWLNESHKESWS